MIVSTRVDRCCVLGHFFEERAVNFHRSDRILPQVRQRRIPGTEVIQSEVHAELRKPTQGGAGRLVREHALSELKL